MSDYRSRDEEAASQNQSWLDRHLGKLIVALVTLCVVGLAIRALVG